MNEKLENLIRINPKDYSVKSRESLHREFKMKYDVSALPKYAKTIAAMANTDGGYMLFGVADRPNRLVGVDPATFPDSASLSDALEKWFDPHINIFIHEFQYEELCIMAIEIIESSGKPVICKKNSTIVVEKKKRGVVERIDRQILCEGAIYRRYSGKTEQIHFAELQEIFTERDRKIYSALLENMANIQRIGVERVGITDISAIGTGGDISKIYLSKEALENLNLIDKGKFVETDAEGETSYFVAGSVQLHGTTEVPVEDQDRIKPGKVALMLSEDARQAFFPEFKMSPAHLFKYAKYAEFRGSDGKGNSRYCKWDEQAGQWFYREAFVRFLRRKILENPRETLLMLSAAVNVEKYDEYQRQKRMA